MLIDFLGPYDVSKSIDSNQSELTNWYLTLDTQSVIGLPKTKSPILAYPTPGLTLFADLGTSTVRGMCEHNGVLYASGGNKFYSLNSSGTKTERGTLNTSSGKVQMATISNQIGMIDGTNGYNYNEDTTTFGEITDPDFIDTATSITSQDEYFIYTKPDTAQFFISDLSDGTTQSSLDFASKLGKSDDLVRAYSHHREVWLMGRTTSEVYFNSGNATFPFERIAGVFVETGCAAVLSAANYGPTLIWLGRSDQGGLKVVRADGYTITPISSESIDYQINSLTTTSDAEAYCYEQEGHGFYVLTFPTEGKTWAYDFKTGLWHQRQSYVSSAYTRHLGSCYAYAFGKHLIGDYQSGKIYQLNPQVYTENGTAIRRKCVTKPMAAEGRQVTCDRIETEWETGVGTNPAIDFRVAKDNGHTFVSLDSKDLGTATDYAHRVYWNSLGRSRSWVFEISTTMTSKCILRGAFGNFRVGLH